MRIVLNMNISPKWADLLASGNHSHLVKANEVNFDIKFIYSWTTIMKLMRKLDCCSSLSARIVLTLAILFSIPTHSSFAKNNSDLNGCWANNKVYNGEEQNTVICFKRNKIITAISLCSINAKTQKNICDGLEYEYKFFVSSKKLIVFESDQKIDSKDETNLCQFIRNDRKLSIEGKCFIQGQYERSEN